MKTLYGLPVVAVEYCVFNNMYSAELDTGETCRRSGFESRKTKRVEISRDDFLKLEREIKQEEINYLAQMRLEQLNQLFEETRMAERRKELERDISRALHQNHTGGLCLSCGELATFTIDGSGHCSRCFSA